MLRRPCKGSATGGRLGTSARTAPQLALAMFSLSAPPFRKCHEGPRPRVEANGGGWGEGRVLCIGGGKVLVYIGGGRGVGGGAWDRAVVLLAGSKMGGCEMERPDEVEAEADEGLWTRVGAAL